MLMKKHKAIATNVIRVVFAVLALQGLEANAQFVSRWIGTDGNWSDENNWDNGVSVWRCNCCYRFKCGRDRSGYQHMFLTGLELNNSSADIVLQHDMFIADSLSWNSGGFSGDSSVILLGKGEINGGFLETTFDNFGSVQFGVNGQFTRIQSETGGVWNNQVR